MAAFEQREIANKRAAHKAAFLSSAAQRRGGLWIEMGAVSFPHQETKP
jgi:hypothetical protein